MAGALVQNEGAVADHAHLVQEQEQPVAVLLAQEVQPAPFRHNLPHHVLVFAVQHALLLGHADIENLVRPPRKLKRHIALAAAQQYALQQPPHHVQVLVARHLAVGIGHGGEVRKAVVRAQTVLVHELDNGVKFLQLVLQRRAREHHRIVRLDAPCRLGYLRVPVLQALRLVHNQQVGLQ